MSTIDELGAEEGGGFDEGGESEGAGGAGGAMVPGRGGKGMAIYSIDEETNNSFLTR